MSKTEKRGLLILSFLSLSFLFFFYGKIIIHPADHLFVDSGDGLKSYYVYQYHVVNDSSYTQTRSINYPYGESHVFTDGQIFFADLFKFIHSFYPQVSDYSIAFLNELMIFSYFFCFLLLYYILRKLCLPVYFSIAGALAIGMLSPQIFRMVSHISLSYCFFIPLIWFLFIRFNESEKKWKYTVLLILTLSVSPFVHGYYLLIGALFLFSLWFVQLLQHPSKIKQAKILLLHAAFQVFIPLIAFHFYLHFFDPHSDRTLDPYGILIFTANLSTIFIPNTEPTYSLFRYFHAFNFQEWEGWAYVGTSMLFILAYSLFRSLRYIVKKNFRAVFKPVLPAILQPAIWASVLVLLYSFGYPYKAHMEFLLDWFPFLKQFRALGRFAWVFYYVFTVYGLYTFYQLLRAMKQKNFRKLALVLQVFFFAILFIEGIGYHKRVTGLLNTDPNPFQFLKLDDGLKEAIHAVDPGKYQALLPLPFYHVGSEAQTRDWTDKSLQESMAFAYHTGMSMIASSCARTSQTEAANIMQLLAPPSFKKSAQTAFRNHKPILITYSKEELPYDEAALLSRATRIFSNTKMELYELSYDSLFYYCGPNDIAAYEKEQPGLHQKNNFLVEDTVKFFFEKSFDNFPSAKIFAGKGAFQGRMNALNYILPDTVFTLDTGEYYEASFWYYNKGAFINFNTVFIQEKSMDGKNADVIANQNTVSCPNIAGDWSLIRMVFRLKHKGDSISISLKGNDDLVFPIYVDELLIRPFFSDIYKPMATTNGAVTTLFKNNILLNR